MNDNETGIGYWMGEVLAFDKVALDAILWSKSQDDPGDHREAHIMLSMLSPDDLNKVEHGAVFDCETVVPHPEDQPLVRNITFRVMNPFRRR